MDFKLHAPYRPTGDQPQAIEALVRGVNEGAKEQVRIARASYEAAGAPGRIAHVIGPEGHRFYAALSWPVFDTLTGWRSAGA